MFLQSKTQPFGKRLGQNQPRWWGKVGPKSTFWKKVGPKHNLLEKGWAKINPDGGKNVGQNTTFLKVEFGPTFFT
jgi:hypothetical protein